MLQSTHHPAALLGIPDAARVDLDSIQALECLRAEVRAMIDFFNLIDTPHAAWPSAVVVLWRRIDGYLEFIENDCIAWGA